VKAFGFFGGVPARLVPDNLKTGVDRPDLYDPKINRSYAELAEHYGCLVDPARSRKPRDKPQVERPMPYIRDSFWRGREFTSLAHMQAEGERWCTGVAGQRACRPLDGAAPAAVFAAAEKGQLAALPVSPFVLARWSQCKAGPDIHVKVGRTLYSVPWRHIGKTLDARSTATMVQLFAGGDLVKTHARKAQGKQTDLADYPPRLLGPRWFRSPSLAKISSSAPRAAAMTSRSMRPLRWSWVQGRASRAAAAWSSCRAEVAASASRRLPGSRSGWPRPRRPA
jgi:hypothetical protein